MTWISYLIVIFRDPGSAIEHFQPKEKEWRRWCKKCQSYKPERSHHSKQMGRCILKMDHYCVWTCNCIGFKNFPHFLRLLGWVEYTTTYTFYYLVNRAYHIYYDEDGHSVSIQKSEILMTVILIPLDFFLMLSVFMMLLRNCSNLISGKTTIEQWEEDRLTSQFRHGIIQRKIKPILEQYLLTTSATIRPRIDSIEDVIFPYDMTYWENLTDALGPSYTWVLPWGGPKGDGLRFRKNHWTHPDIGFGLPWPLDHQDEDPPSNYRADPDFKIKPRHLFTRLISNPSNLNSAQNGDHLDSTFTSNNSYRNYRSRTRSGSIDSEGGIQLIHINGNDNTNGNQNLTSVPFIDNRRPEDEFWRPEIWQSYDGENLSDFGVDDSSVTEVNIYESPVQQEFFHNLNYTNNNRSDSLSPISINSISNPNSRPNSTDGSEDDVPLGLLLQRYDNTPRKFLKTSLNASKQRLISQIGDDIPIGLVINRNHYHT